LWALKAYQRAVGYNYNAVKVMQTNAEPVYPSTTSTYRLIRVLRNSG
jgi:hypothetical protein